MFCLEVGGEDTQGNNKTEMPYSSLFKTLAFWDA